MTVQLSSTVLARGGGITDFLLLLEPPSSEQTGQLAQISQPGALVTLVEVLTSQLGADLAKLL